MSQSADTTTAPSNGMAARGGGAARGGRGRGRGGTRGGGAGGSGAVKKGGPAPARHIPWPEIFKHHISLVEGHLKMIDMVRKHTVEGTGNHRTISSLVERARVMLKDARATEREFVPPREAWRNVPIGSASDTMYPGYSPKDHQYGKAAEEFGKQWSAARKEGLEFTTKPDGPEYQFGQSKGAKKRRLSSEDKTAQHTSHPAAEQPNGAIPSETTNDGEGAGTPLFFFDSNPAPVNTTHAANTVVHYENIDREVDARLKLKEEAQRNKTDKKRKRESVASPEESSSIVAAGGVSQGQDVGKEKPAKKKSKNKNKNKDASAAGSGSAGGLVSADVGPDEDVEMKDAGEEGEGVVDGSATGKKNKNNKGKGNEKVKNVDTVVVLEDGQGTGKAKKKKGGKKKKSKE